MELAFDLGHREVMARPVTPIATRIEHSDSQVVGANAFSTVSLNNCLATGGIVSIATVVYTHYFNATQFGLDCSATQGIEQRAKLVKRTEMQHHTYRQIGQGLGWG
jgi:hypothetical protein